MTQPIAYHTLETFITPEGVRIPSGVDLPAVGASGFDGMVAVQYKGRAYAVPEANVRPIFDDAVAG